VVLAAGEGCKCTIRVDLTRRRQTTYDSPQEFLALFTLSDIPDLRGVMILYSYSALSGPSLSATVHLVRGLWQRPFVTVNGAEPALVEGVAGRLAGLFRGPRLRWQGLRPPGVVPRLRRLRIRAAWVVTVVVTAAISAAVTIFVTALLK